MVDEAVGDARLVGDVGHAAGVEAAPREHADRRVEDQPALVDAAVAGAGRAIRRRLLRPRVGGAGAVGQARQLGAHVVLAGEVEVGDDVGLARVVGARQHLAPRVDDHRVAVGVAHVGGWPPTCAGGDHERLVLDRAGAQQDLPVRGAGRRA